MTRQAAVAALLALLAGLTLKAAPPGRTVIFTCGTAKEPARRTEGRIDNWNFAALSFTPDLRGRKALVIPYKSITRLEFGSTPSPRAEPLLAPPCLLKRQDHYLTVFYTGDNGEEQDGADSKEAKDSKLSQAEKDRQARQDRRDHRDRRERGQRSDAQIQGDSKDQSAREQEFEKEKVHVVVFELGDSVRRDTLRIIETRSGRRVTYQDAAARKAAR